MVSEEQKGTVTTKTSRPLTVVVQVPAEIVMYNVSEPELEALASGSNSIHLVFFGVSIGALIAFTIAILTVQLEARLFATFAALLAVSILATAYFCVRTITDLRANNRRLNHIQLRRHS